MKLCKIIGMPVINRSPTSCKYKTTFCSKYCYNNKMYMLFGKKIKASDIRNDEIWNNLTPENFKEELSHIRAGNNRIRFMARGEAFSVLEDVYKVRSLMLAVPDYLFWIPTRAWRDKTIKFVIENQIMTLPNSRVMASIDPSNSKEEIDSLKASNWSTMFFGDNNDTEGRVKCPKTWLKKKGGNKMHRTCRYCDICFSKERIDVHLKKH